jgi:hypothetical protein
MFSRLVRRSSRRNGYPASSQAGARFGSGFELLEERAVPALTTFNVNTANDTAWSGRLVNGVPVDVNN